jgi:alanyl-tRNA synthetase
VTGEGALAWVAEQNTSLQAIAAQVKASPANVTEKVDSLFQKNKVLEKEIEQLKAKLAAKAGADLSTKAIEVNGIKVLAAELKGVDSKSLRDTVDQLKNKLGKAVVVLAAVNGDKVSLIAGVTKAETSRYKAGELVNHIASQVGGKGGGRPDMAQAGGNQPENIVTALASVEAWVQAKQ